MRHGWRYSRRGWLRRCLLTVDRPAIRLDRLSRDFGLIRAVDQLSLDVPRGTVFGFLGPNGAGKTTTIHLLLGLLEPTSGRAEILGLDPWLKGAEIRSRTGALLDHNGIYEGLTAEDNLGFYARVWGMGQAERDTRIAELLGGTALWERRHEKAGTWSRGMQQRLALARALLHRPSMLFLDEPTAGLDVMAAIQVRNDLSELPGREGMTIFLTTHNMAEAEQLCDLVAVVRGGRLLACGSPAQLRAGAGRPRIEVSGRGFDEATVSALRQRSEVVAVDRTDAGLTIELDRRVEPAPLVGLLVRHGAEVDEVRRVQVSLEEVFVALVEEDR